MPFGSLRCSIAVDAPEEESYDPPITKTAHTPARQVKTDLVVEFSGNSGIKLSA